MSQYLVQTTPVADHIGMKLRSSNSRMWGPNLIHQQILKLDKQIEPAVDQLLQMDVFASVVMTCYDLEVWVHALMYCKAS